jgi:LysM repeat protein
MSKNVQNVRVKGGMKRYRAEQAALAAKRAGLPLPPAFSSEDADYVSDAEAFSQKSTSSRPSGLTPLFLGLGVLAVVGIVWSSMRSEPLVDGSPPQKAPEAAGNSAPIVAATEPSPAELLSPASGKHTVTGNETLASIAGKHNLTEEQLRQANPTVSQISVGHELVIPEVVNVITAAESQPKNLPQEIATAPQPRAGERNFEVNEESSQGYVAVGRPKDIQPDVIPEQRSIAPTSPLPPNNLAGSPSAVGLFSQAPTGVIPGAASEAQAAPRPKIIEQAPPRPKIIEEPKQKSGRRQTGKVQQASGSRSVKVRSGDTIYSVSKRLGITEAELRECNGLSSDTIREGSVLYGPE